MAGPTAVNAWAWYKADAGTSTTVDGEAISQWDDSSGNARHATQGTGANQATYQTNELNGLPVVRFDGSNDFFNVPDASALTASTVFIVVKIDTDPPIAEEQTGLWHLGTAVNATHYPYTDGVIYDAFGTTARKTTVDPTPALTSFRIYGVVSAANDWRSYLDGVNLHTTGTNTVGLPSAPRLGGFTGTYFLDGDVAEFVLYDSALSTGDRQDVEAALTTKWFTQPAAPSQFVIRPATQFV
jgi:hypothetical protein